MRERPRGSLEAVCSKTGFQSAPFCGSMENVSPPSLLSRSSSHDGFLACIAGSGNSLLWFVISLLVTANFDNSYY